MLKQIRPVIRLETEAFCHESFMARYFFLNKKKNCVMTENVSSNKMQLQLRFVLKNKDLKSKVKTINLKLILLNQLK